MNPRQVVGLKQKKKIDLSYSMLPEAQAPATAQLAYHGGPVIQNVKVVTVYWGSAWASDPLRTTLDEFFNFVVQSSLIDQLSEYNTPTQTIGRGFHTASLLVTADPGPLQDDVQIQDFLHNQIASSALPAADVNTVYFVFMPQGTTVTLQGAQSCRDFCGYHSVTSDGIFYAVDTYDDCAGCQFVPGDTVASSTVVASHEFCEAITDPELNAWFDDNTGNEIGDICEGSNKVINAAGTQSANTTNYVISGTATPDMLGNITGVITLTPVGGTPPPPPPPPTGQSWTVQKEWSNAQGACV